MWAWPARLVAAIFQPIVPEPLRPVTARWTA